MTYFTAEKLWSPLFVTVTLCCLGHITAEAAKQLEWLPGDPRWCLERLWKGETPDEHTQMYEVLPGLGWDNLRNVESAPVISYNYSNCRLTDDGHFLIPDNVFIIPLKRSKMQTFAELIDEWKDYKSVTAKSINTNAGISFAGYSISGKFSKDYAQVKGKQIAEKSATIRTQLRYHRYKSKLRPEFLLSPEFKSSLLAIATHLEMNQTDRARYESELLVRNFGTHFLTSVTSGAGLIKEDYVKRSYVENNKDDRTGMLLSANAAFKDTFEVSAGVDTSKRDQLTETMGYQSNLTNSYTETLGGNVFLAGGMTATDWAKNIDANLVAMDRMGDPLYMLVTQKTLPELPLSTVEMLEAMVRGSVKLYYKMNVIPGCTDRTFAKFSITANFDDGSCKTEAETGLALGGFYQMCDYRGEKLQTNPCTSLNKMNALTGQLSCPDGFIAVFLHGGKGPEIVEYKKKCSRCKLVSTCCENKEVIGWGYYKTFWCAGRADKLQVDATSADDADQPSRGKRAAPMQSQTQTAIRDAIDNLAKSPLSDAAIDKVADDKLGYSFGGVFTQGGDNLVTNTRTCPEGFYARTILLDLNVCISADDEIAGSSSIPFGGFFSCTMGNPLAWAELELERKGDSTPLKQLIAKASSGVSKWPKKCPTGYSQHLATEVNGCAIHYCAESGAIKGTQLPNVRRPPFSLEPPEAEEGPQLVFDKKSMSWIAKSSVTNLQQPNVQRMDQQSSSSDHTVQSSGQTDSGFGLKVQTAPGSGYAGQGGLSAVSKQTVQTASVPGGAGSTGDGSGSRGKVLTQMASGDSDPGQDGYVVMKSQTLIGIIVAALAAIGVLVAVAVYVMRVRELRDKMRRPHTEVTPLRHQGTFNLGAFEEPIDMPADESGDRRSTYRPNSETLSV